MTLAKTCQARNMTQLIGLLQPRKLSESRRFKLSMFHCCIEKIESHFETSSIAMLNE